MVIELTWAGVLGVLGGITALGAAGKVIVDARAALNKPREDLDEKLAHYDRCLENDAERLDLLEKRTELLLGDMTEVLLALEASLSHFETGNNTGDIARVRSNLNKHNIDRRTQLLK